MRALLFIILYSWGQTACSRQTKAYTIIKATYCHTVRLKVQKVRTTSDGKVVYWFKSKDFKKAGQAEYIKLPPKEQYNYISICQCLVVKWKKGDYIPFCWLSLEVLKVGFEKIDLEN